MSARQPVMRALELGAEHGTKAAKEWMGREPHAGFTGSHAEWRRALTTALADPERYPLPEPDLLTGEGTFAAVCQQDLDVYGAAFRAAVEATVRARCEQAVS